MVSDYTLFMWALPVIAVVAGIAFALRRTKWNDVALRASRWTYAIVVPLSLLYFPLKAGRVRPIECEWTFNASLALYSLRNVPHIVMFAILYLVTIAQLPNVRYASARSLLACLVIGFLVEIAEGATGFHHCRMRDLIPDMAGAALGAMVLWIVRRVSRARSWT